jgi:hypothetical protein
MDADVGRFDFVFNYNLFYPVLDLRIVLSFFLWFRSTPPSVLRNLFLRGINNVFCAEAKLLQ